MEEPIIISSLRKAGHFQIVDRLVEICKEQHRVIKVDANLDKLIIWESTDEGHTFWQDIYVYNNVDLFYQRYPKINIALYNKYRRFYRVNRMKELTEDHKKDMIANGFEDLL